MKKKILIVTPKFPYPPKGACELDRALGLEKFLELGYEVYLITKIYDESIKECVSFVSGRMGVTIVPVCYKYLSSTLSRAQKWKKNLARIIQPWYWDGAAYEYSEPEIQKEVKKALETFDPDLVWFDYTYLWPLYKIVKKKGIPIVTRSINFEAMHFLEEDGYSFFNYIKFLPKVITEYIVSKRSNIIFAITPKEKKTYEKIGARKVVTLPLRGLPQCFENQIYVVDRTPLNVFFFGSTYNVAHNRAALEFLLTKIIPEAQKRFPGEFRFNIFGGKVPLEFNQYFRDEVIYHGHVPFEELSKILLKMDVGVTPSLYGAGMQQKIFEPLCRGFATVTSSRGLADYPFEHNKHLLLASTVEDFVDCLGQLRNPELRRKLSDNAKKITHKLFSKEEITSILENSLKDIF